MADISFDVEAFWERSKLLLNNIKRIPSAFNQADSVVVVVNDKSDESVNYSKPLALQLWLLGYELPGTVFVFVKNAVYVLTSAKKKALLQQLGESGQGCELHILTVNKEDKNAANIAQLSEVVRAAGRKVGLVTYKNVEGDQATTVIEHFNKSSSGFEVVDVTLGLAETWAVKDEKELKHVRKAAELSTDIFKMAVDKVEEVIDSDSSITHEKLTEQIEKIFADPVAHKIKGRPEHLESCYSPIFMSGGRYDLKASATSDSEPLHTGTIVIELGARYRSYCSNIVRTLFIDPSDEQKECYRILLKVYAACTQTLRNGVPLNKVWEAAVSVIKAEKESLLPHFTKNCGFATGLEFREPAMVINEKATAKARTHMVYNICVGFGDLKKSSSDPRGQTYSVMVADTVIVTDDVCETLTHFARKMGELSYSLGDGNDDSQPQDKDAGDVKDDGEDGDGQRRHESVDPSIFRRKTRSQDEAIAAKVREQAENDKRRREHQRELWQAKLKTAEDSIARGEMGVGINDPNQQRQAKDIVAYETPSRFPLEARPYQIFVDEESESVLFPIYGRLVPFHIDTIRSVSMPTEEPPFTYVHFYFDSPQKILGKNAKIDTIAPPTCMYIQDIGYRSRDPRNLNKVLQQVKDLKKKVQQRQKEAEEKQSLIEQADLIVGRNGAFAKLRDVTVRPVLIGRKNVGQLECHQNGFRFSTAKGAKGDFTFANIKHAFYQEASEQSPSVLIHFHLKNEIMWGKKKTKDLQFYVEVVDMSQDLGNIRSRYGDQDGIQEEQEERLLRQKTNERFLEFVKRVEETVPDFKKYCQLFDAPYRDLRFTGTPAKQMVDLMPTLHCLTALDDQPPFVLSLADVELVHFERLQGSLKNFDLVFVFKDYNRLPLRVSAIPRSHVESIKDWLDLSNIVFTRGAASFNWKEVMDAVRSDIVGFWEGGGWDFLDAEGDLEDPNKPKRKKKKNAQMPEESEQGGGENAEEGGDEDDEENAPFMEFDQSDDESEEESEYEESSDEDDDDDDEDDDSDDDFSDEDDDDSEEYEDEDDEESDEDDWDELERRAAEEDRRRDREEMDGDSDDSDAPKKKKRALPASSSSSSKPVGKPVPSSSSSAKKDVDPKKSKMK